MKKILFLLTTMFTIVASACWFGFEDVFFYPSGRVYISSVNWKHFHVLEHNAEQNKIINGQEVDLPISVQIKVGNLDVIERVSVKDESSDSVVYEYRKVDAVSLEKIDLFYRVERDGKIIISDTLVKSLSSLDWKMSFGKPLDVFGSDGLIKISESKIQKGDAIIIYLAVEQSLSVVDNNSTIQTPTPPTPTTNESYSPKQTEVAGQIEISEINTNWSEYLVFKVIYSGKRRIII